MSSSNLRPRSFLSALAFVLTMAVASVALAGPAKTKVRERQSKITSLLKKKAPKKRVARAMSSLFNYRVIAKRSMGKRWAKLSPAERKELTDVLSKLVRLNMEKNLRKTLNYSVSFTGEKKSSVGTWVKTEARSKTNKREDPYEIDYLMKKTGKGLRAIDVRTEGSSMVRNYRRQFARVMKKLGFRGLMKKLNKRYKRQKGS